MMRIGRCWYPVTTLGYGKRVGIWFQGCARRCPQCISPEFQDPQMGRYCSPEEVMNCLPADGDPDGLTVSGGEPFDQPEGLLELVLAWKKRFRDDVLVFTGYTLEELHQMNSPIVEAVLKEIAVLVDGRYIQEENDGIGLRGSANQKVHVWKCEDKHKDLEQISRSLQCVFYGDHLWMIGIPPK